MNVILPVLADVRVDDRHAIAQVHPCGALVRLPVLLNVVLLGCSMLRLPAHQLFSRRHNRDTASRVSPAVQDYTLLYFTLLYLGD
jgi:hypothetical protein